MRKTKKMKKTMILVFTLLLMAIPLTAFGATTDTPAGQIIRGFCGIDTTKLSDTQKADMLSSWKTMMEAKKTAINKMVANGTITKEDGAESIKAIDDLIKYREANGFATGTGYGMMGGRHGNGGRGMNGSGGGWMNGGFGHGYVPSSN